MPFLMMFTWIMWTVALAIVAPSTIPPLPLLLLFFLSIQHLWTPSSPPPSASSSVVCLIQTVSCFKSCSCSSLHSIPGDTHLSQIGAQSGPNKSGPNKSSVGWVESLKHSGLFGDALQDQVRWYGCSVILCRGHRDSAEIRPGIQAVVSCADFHSLSWVINQSLFGFSLLRQLQGSSRRLAQWVTLMFTML